MTDAVQAFTLALSPGGNPSNPVVAQCQLGWSRVGQILINFPPGCSGLVGVQVRYAGNPVYPIGPQSYFVLDSYAIPIAVTNQRPGGQWSIAGYNQDVFSHTVTAYFFFDYLASQSGLDQSGLISL